MKNKYLGIGLIPYDFYLKESEPKKMKIKIIHNVDDGDGDIAIYLDDKCIFLDHGHNLNPGELLSTLGFEVEEIDEWA